MYRVRRRSINKSRELQLGSPTAQTKRQAGQPDFNYTPLDPNHGSIRLVQVQPFISEDGYIECTMREVDIDATYTCLSYQWGPHEPSQWTKIGDALFEVQQHLWNYFNAIRQRSSKASAWLWIEALSINQKDPLERSIQVQQMGQIYARAEHMISWLGVDEMIVVFIAGHHRKHNCETAREAFMWSTY